MAGTQGYYSVIQYCPDLSRAETVNVGVLLFCPSRPFIGARMSTSNQRVRRLFGDNDLDLQRLDVTKRGIEQRLHAERGRFRTLEDLTSFIDTRANALVMTPPRFMKVLEPEADLDALFAELVGGRVTSKARQKLPQELIKAFGQLEQRGLVWRRAEVTIPNLGARFVAPYAYQNGAINLVKPERFGDERAWRRRAMPLAIAGDQLQRHSVSALAHRLIVVSIQDGAAQAGEHAAESFLGDYGVRFVPNAAIPSFVAEIAREAHQRTH